MHLRTCNGIISHTGVQGVSVGSLISFSRLRTSRAHLHGLGRFTHFFAESSFAVGESQPDDVDDLLLLGESLYRHLVGMAQAGEEVVALNLGQVIGDLTDSISTISGILENHADMRPLSTVASEGARGRAKLSISQEQVEFLLEHRFSASDIAQIVGVSRSTISRRMRDWGLRVSQVYSIIDDTNLDRAVLEVKQSFPDCGYRMMMGLLRARGVVVQRQRACALVCGESGSSRRC